MCNTEREPVWACPVCTFFNPHSAQACEACDAVCGPPSAADSRTHAVEAECVQQAEKSSVQAIETELASLLEQLSLTRLAPSFAGHEVFDMAALRLLTEEDLQTMGIAMGSRRKLLDALAPAPPPPEPLPRPPAPAPPPSGLLCPPAARTPASGAPSLS